MKRASETGKYWDRPHNVFTGCTPVEDQADPCGRCWARGFATRLHGPDAFKPTFHLDRVHAPKSWRKPRVVFCNNVSDWLHRDFTDDQIIQFLDGLWEAPQHQYLLLTKRPERLPSIQLRWWATHSAEPWPGNWWTGVSFWDHHSAIKNLRHLLPCYGQHWCSYESMLGPAFLKDALEEQLNFGTLEWVTLGAETGKDRRPADPEWFPEPIVECLQAGIPAWIKAYPREDGGVTHGLEEMPKIVRVRQMPPALARVMGERL
jgi:protein gp37